MHLHPSMGLHLIVPEVDPTDLEERKIGDDTSCLSAQILL